MESIYSCHDGHITNSVCSREKSAEYSYLFFCLHLYILTSKLTTRINAVLFFDMEIFGVIVINYQFLHVKIDTTK